MGSRQVRRDPQAGRVVRRVRGDRGEIVFPDRGAAPLKVFVRKFRDRPADGYGSHHDGRHKKG